LPLSSEKRTRTINKVLLGTVLMIAATSAAAAQGFAAPYGYGVYGTGGFPGTYAYVREPYAAPPIAYGFDPYGTARSWQYYRPSGPGRGNEESTR